MSVYSTSLQGLIIQSKALNSYAQNIANSNSTGDIATDAHQPYTPLDPVTLSAKAGDLIGFASSDSIEHDLVASLVAKDSYEANAKVIKTQRDMDRDLLNIFT